MELLTKNKGPWNKGKRYTKYTADVFIEKFKKIHGDKYDYRLSVFGGLRDKVKIICKFHGVFEQRASNHLFGIGCPECGKNRIGKTSFNIAAEKFVEEAKRVHRNKYNYSEVIYNGAGMHVNILCNKHGFFNQSPSHHLNGQGCPVCKESHGEREVKHWLEDNNIQFKREYFFKECRNQNMLRFDFYLPDFNLCIEFNGKQHYHKSSKFYDVAIIEHDKIKNEFCKMNGIKLITIPFWHKKNVDEILSKNIWK